MEWKAANILFADVKGYSALSDTQMRTFSQKVLGELADRIKGFNIVERNTWGDGIVMISASITDLCEAALHMRDYFSGTNWSRHELPILDVRISIHHGEYLSGDDAFTGKTAFCGRTVVTAARIEPITPPGKIWMTEAAAVMLKQQTTGSSFRYFGIDSLGSIYLAKKYGSADLFHLRRDREPKMTDGDLEEIKEAATLRERTALGDSDRIEFEKSISSFFIVIGVVRHEGKVLLVKRRLNKEGLTWMFPSGKKWPTDDAAYVVAKEVLEETGLQCKVKSEICQVERHPLTGFKCVYFELEPNLPAEIRNGDPLENEEVRWVANTEALSMIGKYANKEVTRLLQGDDLLK